MLLTTSSIKNIILLTRQPDDTQIFCSIDAHLRELVAQHLFSPLLRSICHHADALHQIGEPFFLLSRHGVEFFFIL